MKTTYSILLALLSLSLARAQLKTLELSHYVFPKFTPGYVLMKSGEKNAALLNYNSVLGEMFFENAQGKMAIADAQLQQVDTVFIAGRRFVPQKDAFLELLYEGDYEFYVEYKCNIKYPGNASAFGQTSQTSSNQSFAMVNIRGALVELSLPDGYKTKPYQHYWLNKNGNSEKFKNLNQLLQLYKSKKNEGKSYIKEHQVKMNGPEGVAGLVAFLEEGNGL